MTMDQNINMHDKPLHRRCAGRLIPSQAAGVAAAAGLPLSRCLLIAQVRLALTGRDSAALAAAVAAVQEQIPTFQ